MQAAIRQLIENQRTETTCRRLGQQFDQIRLGGKTVEVNEGNPQLPGQGLRDTRLGDVAALDKNPTELAPGPFLLIKGYFQLLLGQQALLYQQVAEADFLRGGHPDLQNTLRNCVNNMK